MFKTQLLHKMLVFFRKIQSVVCDLNYSQYTHYILAVYLLISKEGIQGNIRTSVKSRKINNKTESQESQIICFWQLTSCFTGHNIQYNCQNAISIIQGLSFNRFVLKIYVPREDPGVATSHSLTLFSPEIRVILKYIKVKR